MDLDVQRFLFKWKRHNDLSGEAAQNNCYELSPRSPRPMPASVNTSPRRGHESLSSPRKQPTLTPRYSHPPVMTTAPLSSRPQLVLRHTNACLLENSIGGKGRRKGQFDNCNALATLSNGNVAVVDTHNNRVQLFNKMLEPISVVGDGKLSSPWGITALPFGKFCVSEGPKRRIVVYTDDGLFVSKFKVHGIEEPCCLATCLVTGNIIVTDYLGPTVYVYDLNGKTQLSFTTQPKAKYSDEFPIPEHIATDKTGRIFLSFGSGVSTIQVFKRDGTFDFEFGNFKSACGIHITAKDNVIIAEREQRVLSLYSINGQLVQQLVTLSNGLQMYPHGVTVVNGGSLAVTVADDMFACPTWLNLFKLG